MRESSSVPVPEEQATRTRFQFSLRGLLLSFTTLVVFVGIATQFGIGGVALAGTIACTWLAIVHRGHRFAWAANALVLLIVSAVLLVAVPNTWESALQSNCHGRLFYLRHALHNYHDAHGCFPPAYIADENGRPMHSWRVLLLPYMEQNDLLKKYRFDEPWDGPNNRLLHGEVLPFYQCPSNNDPPRKNGSRNTADYLAVVGPGTAWPGGEPLRMAEITDDPAETILLVEVADSDVIWCEPRDLHVGQMSPTVNSDAGQGISSLHSAMAHVVTAERSVHRLPSSTTPEFLRALLTVGGGESIDPSLWEQN